MRASRRGGALLLGGATLLASAVTVAIWPRLFDSTPSGVARLQAARCTTEGGVDCGPVRHVRLGPGRYWLRADAPGARTLTLDFVLEKTPRVLLLGAGSGTLEVEVLRVATTGGSSRVDREATGDGVFGRRLVRIAAPDSTGALSVVLSRTEGSGTLELGEVGLFDSDHALLRDARWLFHGRPDRLVYNAWLARLCVALAALALAASLLPSRPWLSGALVFALTLAAVSLELWLVHNPYWHGARDLRVVLASGPLQHGTGANLNYGIHLGSRLLQGEGLTFGPRWVPWERMPGYGFLGALAGIVAGTRTDLLAIGVASIQIHLLLLAAANAVFVAAARRVMHPALAMLAALAVTFMPNQIAHPQADSIMVPVYLLTAAAIAHFLAASRTGTPSARAHVAVHLSFALWLLMRPDGAVGWAAVSIWLHWRRMRWLLLPAALYLAIGVPWAAYKYRYTGEISTTTNTVGETAWIGLWQVPQDRFRWRTSDGDFFAWAEARGLPPTSKRASDAGVREVVRFAATYPVYVAHVLLHKFVAYVDVDVFNTVYAFPRLVYERYAGPPIWALFTVMTLCLLLGHERRRTLGLGWPVLFNLPLFLLFFSDGMRHVAAVSAALLVATLPPLLEKGFYLTLWRRWRLALAVGALSVAGWHLLHWLDARLLADEAWRYWTPFLDPAAFADYLRPR